MSDAKVVVKNTLYLTIAQAISFIAGVVYIKMTTTYLGPADYGTLSFAWSFTLIFGSLMDLGLGWLTARDVARDHTLVKKYLATH